MKKKQLCFVKRFAALVAALMLCASLCVPCFASVGSSADMPSIDAFKAHMGQWYVWRTIDGDYELIADPLVFGSDGYVSGSVASYHNVFSDISCLSSSGKTYSYACALPKPIRSKSGTSWSSLPSFPISSGFLFANSYVRFYPASASSSLLSSLYLYIVPLFSSSSDRDMTFSYSSGDSTDSFESVAFDCPFFQYPFAFRTFSSSSSSSYAIIGGSQDFCTASNSTSFRGFDLSSSKFLSGNGVFVSYPDSYILQTSDIGFVFVSKPDSNYVTSASSYDVTVKGSFSLVVPHYLLGDIDVGSWLSADDLEKLQDQLVNDFDVNSGTLKNSKDNLNSWNSTSSIDSHVASGAVGLLNGIFQNLGTFLFSVSLLCFGAVVLRMLIRKAVDG